MARMRKLRCSSCSQPFRTLEADRSQCQHCDGSHDNSADIERENENIRRANALPKKAPQSVDPRTGLPTASGSLEPTPSTTQPTTPKKGRTRAKS